MKWTEIAKREFRKTAWPHEEFAGLGMLAWARREGMNFVSAFVSALLGPLMHDKIGVVVIAFIVFLGAVDQSDILPVRYDDMLEGMLNYLTAAGIIRAGTTARAGKVQN